MSERFVATHVRRWRIEEQDNAGAVIRDNATGRAISVIADNARDVLMVLAALNRVFRNKRACAHCGAMFEAGRGAGRRADAKFCSDEHRVAFNSLKRSNHE